MGQRGGDTSFPHAKDGGIFTWFDAFGNPFPAAPVECDYRIAPAAKVYRDEMMALFRGESDFGGLALGWPAIDAEIGHGAKMPATRCKRQPRYSACAKSRVPPKKQGCLGVATVGALLFENAVWALRSTKTEILCSNLGRIQRLGRRQEKARPAGN